MEAASFWTFRNLSFLRTRTTDILDSALLRPGRIDRKIEFPPPGPEARVAILRIHSRKVWMAVHLDEIRLLNWNCARCPSSEA
jgi:26S proteasome regulatory subunit T6